MLHESGPRQPRAGVLRPGRGKRRYPAGVYCDLHAAADQAGARGVGGVHVQRADLGPTRWVVLHLRLVSNHLLLPRHLLAAHLPLRSLRLRRRTEVFIRTVCVGQRVRKRGLRRGISLGFRRSALDKQMQKKVTRFVALFDSSQLHHAQEAMFEGAFCFCPAHRQWSLEQGKDHRHLRSGNLQELVKRRRSVPTRTRLIEDGKCHR
mmetsp:Transcript_10691/g.26190  ORF Transcript_10691/g.26190 Transcript_10691/m.26190 type:complete len:206 (+) Transcript_10691:313-930(+)